MSVWFDEGLIDRGESMQSSESNGMVTFFWTYLWSSAFIENITLIILRNFWSTSVKKMFCSKWFRGISAWKLRVIQGCCKAWSAEYLRLGFGSHNFSIKLWVNLLNFEPNLRPLKFRAFCLYYLLSSPLTQRGCLPAMISYIINPMAQMSTGLPYCLPPSICSGAW